MRQTNSLSPCLRSLLCSQKQKYSKPWSTLDFPNSRRPKEPTSTKGYPTQNTTLPASCSIMHTLSLKGELHSHRCCQQQSIAHSHLMRAEPPHNFFSAQWKNLHTRQFFKLPQDIATALLMLETSTIRVQTPAIFSCFTMQFEEKTPYFGYKIKYVSAEKLRTKKRKLNARIPKKTLFISHINST